CGANHSLCVLNIVRKRLFTQDMLARCQQCFDDVTVQEIRDNHADHVDVICFNDCLPRGVVALKAKASSGGLSQVLVGISNRYQANFGQGAVVGGRCGQIPRCVGFASHASANDSDADFISVGLISDLLSHISSPREVCTGLRSSCNVM